MSKFLAVYWVVMMLIDAILSTLFIINGNAFFSAFFGFFLAVSFAMFVWNVSSLQEIKP